MMLSLAASTRPRPFAAFAFTLGVALVAACSGSARNDSQQGGSCEPVTCKLGCPNGYDTDASGCEICKCKPPVCDPVGCNLFCEGGYATGPDGCEICECAPVVCDGPNPAGCVVNGCPTDAMCDTTQGCTSSSCSCDAASGSWVCTNDCGGGICVPSGGACDGPDPSGCSSKGCPMGQICDTGLGCLPSGCACDVSTGTWGCTADCGGGVCVPDPAGCAEPDPTGCMKTACPIGETCQLTSGLCIPSWCTCEAQTGTWACTADCEGGVCVAD